MYRNRLQGRPEVPRHHSMCMTTDMFSSIINYSCLLSVVSLHAQGLLQSSASTCTETGCCRHLSGTKTHHSCMNDF
jgi:hypothetical protein